MVLLALVMAFFGMTAMRAVLVYRRTGINPVKLRRDDSVHGVLDRILKASVACWLFVSMVYALAPAMKPWLAPITYLETGAAHTTGAVVAATAILWIAVAQAQMSASFRMGFDPSEKTDLICDGPFSLSRNPIYLGILVGVGGFFLMAPNALSFGAAVIAFIGISVQVRLEEEYLLSKHDEAYSEYRSAVRRWI